MLGPLIFTFFKPFSEALNGIELYLDPSANCQREKVYSDHSVKLKENTI